MSQKLTRRRLIKRVAASRAATALTSLYGSAVCTRRPVSSGECLASVNVDGWFCHARGFALTSIASAMKVSGGVIEDVRMAVSAVEYVPRRLIGGIRNLFANGHSVWPDLLYGAGKTSNKNNSYIAEGISRGNSSL